MSGCPSTGRNLGNALSARKSTRSPSLDNYRASREAVERSGAHGVVLRAVAPQSEQDAGDLASEGDDGDELAAAFLDLERPGGDKALPEFRRALRLCPQKRRARLTGVV